MDGCIDRLIERERERERTFEDAGLDAASDRRLCRVRRRFGVLLHILPLQHELSLGLEIVSLGTSHTKTKIHAQNIESARARACV
jgi:hypothetical protein